VAQASHQPAAPCPVEIEQLRKNVPDRCLIPTIICLLRQAFSQREALVSVTKAKNFVSLGYCILNGDFEHRHRR